MYIYILAELVESLKRSERQNYPEEQEITLHDWQDAFTKYVALDPKAGKKPLECKYTLRIDQSGEIVELVVCDEKNKVVGLEGKTEFEAMLMELYDNKRTLIVNLSEVNVRY